MTFSTHASPPPDCTVGELIDRVGLVLRSHVGVVQVSGTVEGHKPGLGHTFGWLVTHHPDTNEPTAKIRVAFQPRIVPGNGSLNGSHIAATGTITTHPLFGPIQFTATVVEILDTESASIRAVERLRRQIVAEGLHRSNKAHPLPESAARLVVICPLGGGAGGADFHQRLSDGGHRWDITTIAIPMGGPNASAAIAEALAAHSRADVDAVVVCRGGGAASDMSAFDTPSVAKAIVQAPKPVIVGIGHATDSHLADLVAHTSRETPSAAADWLNHRRSRAAAQARDHAVLATQAQAIAAQARATADQNQAEIATQRVRNESLAAARTQRRARVAIAAALVIVLAAVAIVVSGVW